MTADELRADADFRDAAIRAALAAVAARRSPSEQLRYVELTLADVLAGIERDRLLADFAATVQGDSGYDSEELHSKLGRLMQRFFKMEAP